jgi:hypothetical protein
LRCRRDASLSARGLCQICHTLWLYYQTHGRELPAFTPWEDSSVCAACEDPLTPASAQSSGGHCRRCYERIYRQMRRARAAATTGDAPGHLEAFLEALQRAIQERGRPNVFGLGELAESGAFSAKVVDGILRRTPDVLEPHGATYVFGPSIAFVRVE